MSNAGKIISTNISEEKGIAKTPVEFVTLNEQGIENDAHAGSWHRQISLLSQESIDQFNQKNNMQIKPGEFAENLTTEGIDLKQCRPLDQLQINDTLLLVSQIGKKCHGDGCAIFKAVGECAMPTQGIFARVLKGGSIKAGDKIEHLMRSLNISVITLSDRAYNHEYPDQSGPTAVNMIEDFFTQQDWKTTIDNIILPDEAERLTATLEQSINNKTDIIFTLGGTGVSPRDIAPETIIPLCDKIIPGIMENIRLKYGEKIPQALLSRSIAGIAQQTQIYALPGSVKAVREYLIEIFKTIEHTLYMMHGLGH